jgi:triphosphatase
VGTCTDFVHRKTVTKVSHEIELKLKLPRGSKLALARLPRALQKNLAEPRRVEQLESLYYDTPRRELREHGISLRIRRNGKQSLQTIKWLEQPLPFDRGEAETLVSGAGPDWNAARGTALEPLLSKKLRRSLKPLFKTKVRRTIYPLATGAAKIDLAVDRGSIVANGRSEPIRELELELKAGRSSELFRVARELSRVVPARLSIKSKADRGYELLNGKSPVAVKAGQVALAPGTSVAEAFRMVARSCLAQIVGNEGGVRARDSESLHQIRIGVRRLRAAISFFKETVRGPDTELVKSELRWITRELSPARDLDVYISQVLAPFRKQYRRNATFPALRREFARERDAAFAHAADVIRSDRYRQLLIELAAWIETDKSDNADDVAARTIGESPIERYAAERLARRRKKILKKIRAFDRLNAAQRHKLRIAVKKFRYAAEAVASVFPTKKSKYRWRKLHNAVKDIQECLGALNDIVAHEKLSLEMLDHRREGHPRLLRDRAFLSGLIAGQREARSAELREGAADAFARFKPIKPFWK